MSNFEGSELLKELKNDDFESIFYYRQPVGIVQRIRTAIWGPVGELFITKKGIYIFRQKLAPLLPDIHELGVFIPIKETKNASIENGLLRIFVSNEGMKRYEEFLKHHKFVFLGHAIKEYEKVDSLFFWIKDTNRAECIVRLIKDYTKRTEEDSKDKVVKEDFRDKVINKWLNGLQKPLNDKQKIILFFLCKQKAFIATEKEIVKGTEIARKTVEFNLKRLSSEEYQLVRENKIMIKSKNIKSYTLKNPPQDL